MKVRYTTHRKASMVGQVEDVRDDWGTRLVAAGHAVRVDDSVPVSSARPARAGRVARPAPAADVPATPAADKPAG